MPPGKAAIRAKKEGYDTVSKTVTVKQDGITTIKISMKPSKDTMGSQQEQQVANQDVGSLVIFNSLGPVDVFIDGEKRGNGSFAVTNIPAGKHDLRVGSFSKEIEILKNHKLKVKSGKNGIIVLNEREQEEEAESAIERDERFVKYPSGIVKDTKTGLEWAVGPDRNTSWKEARDWVLSLGIDGGGWRMPTIEELKGLYQKGKGERNMTPLLKTTGWRVWAKETRGSPSEWYFDFYFGPRIWDFRLTSRSRAFAVRSR
jgi:hypothetical protein